MLSIGKDFCVICSEAISSSQRFDILSQLEAANKQIIDVKLSQAEQSFCCNLLQLQNASGEPVIAMSENAYNGFSPQQRRMLEQHGSLAIADISTIEYVGGGSLRCMIAENFLPKEKG